MGSYQRTKVVETWYGCDTPKCTAELTVPARYPDNHWWDRDHADAAAKSLGWSRWCNRSSFYYCPDHGPRSSNLRKIW